MASLMLRSAQAEYKVSYEFRRVGILLAGVLLIFAGKLFIPGGWARWLYAAVMLSGYPALLWVAGFFNAEEKAAIVGFKGKLRRFIPAGAKA
jgi:hypothetical protein